MDHQAKKQQDDHYDDSICQWLHQHAPLTVQKGQEDEDVETRKRKTPPTRSCWKNKTTGMPDVSSDDENIASVARELRLQVSWLESELQAEGTRYAHAVAGTAVIRWMDGLQ